jgi:predicted transport protein
VNHFRALSPSRRIQFRRLFSFACVKVRSKDLQVWTRLDPSSVVLEEGFTRDVSQLGHAGKQGIWKSVSSRQDDSHGREDCGRAEGGTVEDRG